MKKIYITLALMLISIFSLQAVDFAGGNGTSEDPFLVATAQHLNEARNHLDKHFLQIADINLNVVPFNMGNYWIPIGGNRQNNEMGNNFTGHYDGNGFNISNLTIVQPGNHNVGLFGHIGEKGNGSTTLKNIVLQNVIVIGGRGTGALVGRVTGNQNTRIENCSVAMGYVRGDAATGGLVGSNNSFMETSLAAEGFRPVIFQCSADVSVLLRSEYSAGKIKFGGLVGCNQKGMISHSYAMGDVTINDAEVSYVGGLVGCVDLRGIVINSYSTSGVYADNSSNTGGFIGSLGLGRNMGVIVNSYWNTDNNPSDLNSLGAIGLTTAQMQNAQSYQNWDFYTIWKTETNVNYGFPAFRDETNSAKTEKSWNGSKDNAWTNPENWTPEGVPANLDMVVIPGGTPNQPVISQLIIINELSIEDNASLNLEHEDAAIVITGKLLGGNESTGTGSITGKGYIELSGSDRQYLPAMTFENLVINNISNVQLSGSIYVNGLLKMTSGQLDLSGYEITLGEDAELQEKEGENISSRVYGSSGVIRTLRILNNPSGQIAGIGLEITSSKDMGLTLIERGHGELNGTDESKSILRWFNIEPATNEDLNATLVFHYFTSELNIYGENDNFSLFKRKSNETEWVWVPSELDALNQKLTAENVNEFSTWTAGSSDSPLPIVLLSFEATPLNHEVEVSWVTAAEINNDFFTVERSVNGVDFEAIHFVQGAGTTSHANHYAVIDHEPLTGLSYYRLKQTDYNGDFEYSNIVSVYTQKAALADMKVYPNPSNGNFNIVAAGEKAIDYKIFDMQGRTVYTSVARAGMVNHVSLPQLKQGIYTLVFFDTELITHKIQVY
ncbi:MAG: T9SS C-terminal target domain-containing protein [Bacteroidetes bacterium]|nr:MAG: T9SS C-terminal target domain-containing protein [Bacteroidota bacterium]